MRFAKKSQQKAWRTRKRQNKKRQKKHKSKKGEGWPDGPGGPGRTKKAGRKPISKDEKASHYINGPPPKPLTGLRETILKDLEAATERPLSGHNATVS